MDFLFSLEVLPFWRLPDVHRVSGNNRLSLFPWVLFPVLPNFFISVKNSILFPLLLPGFATRWNSISRTKKRSYPDDLPLRVRAFIWRNERDWLLCVTRFFLHLFRHCVPVFRSGLGCAGQDHDTSYTMFLVSQKNINKVIFFWKEAFTGNGRCYTTKH